jgi:UDP-GlcNAc:undecaprenyl-phosphate GlcNAc-1-phosphate transferase
LAGGVVLLALGAFDDHRREGLTTSARLGIESLVAAAVWWAGLRPDLSVVPGIDLVLTVFFLVAAANAFNLLDNMDGVAGSTAVASAAGIVVLASLFGDPLVAGFAATVGGAALGFLHHNLGGGVFLGNGGALFLGFVLGGAALLLHVPLPGSWSIPAAVVIMAVPAADTTLVIIGRILARRPVTQGGTDHASHRLVAAGLSPVSAAASHAGAAAVAAVAVGAAAAYGRPEILLLVLVTFAGAGLGLLRVPVYPLHNSPPRHGRRGVMEILIGVTAQKESLDDMAQPVSAEKGGRSRN